MKSSFATLIAGSGLFAATVLWGLGPAFASEPTMADMQWHRRVLIVSTPRADDMQFLTQDRQLSEWTGGDERDVSVVRIVGDAVSGSSEAAAALRDRYHVTAATFSVALIGKDGHMALHSETALTGAQLEAVIDAMPMRKAGQR